MTSSTSVDEAKGDICENGFFKIDNLDIGSGIEAMHTSHLSFDFSEEAGFNFCRDHILLNSYIQDIIKALGSDVGSQYVLAHRGSLAQDPGHIYTLQNGGKDPGVLIVQLWPKGLKVTYHAGSHRAPLKRIRASNRFWEVASKELKDIGCKAEQRSFEHGGLVIFDARISFEREEKRSYYYTYVKLSLLKQWQEEDEWGLQPPVSQSISEVAKLGVYMRRGDSQGL